MPDEENQPVVEGSAAAEVEEAPAAEAAAPEDAVDPEPEAAAPAEKSEPSIARRFSTNAEVKRRRKYGQ